MRACLMLAVFARLGQPGADASPATSVSWRAPAGCPDAATVRAGIERLTGGPGGSAVRVDARVEAVQGGFALTLHVEAGAVVDDRMLVAERCEALADTTALVAAIAADPIATAAVVDVEAIVEATHTIPSGDGDPTEDGVVQRESPRAVAREEPTRPRAPRRAPAPKGAIGVWTRVRVGGQSGALPGLNAGFEAAIAVGRRRIRGELAGSYWLPRQTQAAGTTLRVQLGTIAPRICATLPQGRIDVLLCAGPELGILRGDVRGGPTRTPLWLAMTAEAGVRAPVSRRVSIWVSVAAAAPLLFPRFRLVDATGTRQREVYRPAAAGARVMLGVEVRLRGLERPRGFLQQPHAGPAHRPSP